MFQYVFNNKVLKESMWAILSKGSAFIAFYALQVFLVRSLSVAEWGLWSFFFSVLSILLLASDLGINLSSKKFIAQYESSSGLPSVLTQSLFLRLGASATFSLVFWWVHVPLLRVIDRTEMAPLFAYVPWVILCFSLLEFFKACSEGFHRLRFHFTLVCIEHWGKLLFLVILFSSLRNLDALVVGLALAYGVGAIAGIIMFHRRFFLSRVVGEYFQIWPQILKYSLPLCLTILIAFVAMEVDTIMLNYLCGDYETGLYATAKQLVFYIPHITLALTMGTMPIFARMKVGERDEYGRKFSRIQNINNGIIIAVLVLIGGSSWYLVPTIFGPEYKASVLPLLCLIPYVFFVSHGLCTGVLLDYRGKAGRRAISMGVTMVANLGLNFIFIPVWGATGAAVATSLAYFPYCFINSIMAKKEFTV